MPYEGAWSVSKLQTFETCRAQYNRRYILKLPEPKPAALVRGLQVHEAIEAWMQGWLKRRPDELGTLSAEFTKLKKLKPDLETMWGFDVKWRPLENGFDKAAWIRAKTDAFLDKGDTVHVFDWKTGKPREVSEDQVRFYGLLALIRHPEAETAKLELWYVDHNKIVDGDLSRADVEKTKKEFTRRANRIYNERKWPEEPGLHCRWCPFRRSIGGPCSY